MITLHNCEVSTAEVSTAEVSTAIEVGIVCSSLYLILGMPISAIVYVVKNLLVSNIIHRLWD